MANVLHNEDVKNEQDLQNLVIGIIFRQDKPFTSDSVIKTVNYWLKGSDFYDNIELIEEHVTDSLDLLQNRDKVRCSNGVYCMKNIITGSFPAEYC